MIYPPEFEQALLLTLAEEGGLSNDPADRGGLTLAGVTQKTYDRYRVELGLLPRSVELSTPEERRDLYFRLFWLEGRCDVLARPASLLHFDCSVNSGPKTASLLLQAIVGARPLDGVIGPNTIARLAAFDARDLARKLITARRGFYVGLLVEEPKDSDIKFINGWLSRMDHIERVL